ncbi:hypothetical protein EDC65_5154 [Stella humosa]|uniref:Uncharacterized protein n=1 Tax=Stella humosa TaxID=94 RepID=A0A3N1KSQ2_9PROT|nr:hypothetical protein [Stella humosa]ROP81298.1 hypothetical protein EDC65_5154 [Stella humosa]BBK32647.1 hypothetical protein STHU_32810 [Stella humosa]
MPPFDFATPEDVDRPASAGRFAYDEIGWIADLAPAIALRRGVEPAVLSGGVILTDAHRDAEPLWRLARHPRLTAAARALLGGDVVVATTLLCLDTGFPAGFVVPGAALVTVHLDRQPSNDAPGALHGRFGSVKARLLDENAPEERSGRTFRVVYVAARELDRWPHARRPEPIGEADLWPAAHLAFG